MIDKRKTLVKYSFLKSMYNHYCVIYKDQT